MLYLFDQLIYFGLIYCNIFIVLDCLLV